MNWRLVLTHSAERAFRRFPKRARRYVVAALDMMAENPFAGDIQKLEGLDDHWRRRVGSYRILFILNLGTRTIFVYNITRRTSATY